ncbi:MULTISPECIES: hypothetical protein [unclassified Pseudofrankia]|uniref:hypothetical protein n=1 Tax=unclassified Pseudofrankia TaxID=2994372 RepID=UPI0010427212|nr:MULTISPECIES: hypothetical protein [unclassified Pseudofrankia]MDT3445580.1 hypothetical protein [Pseudofrankia sp. BMG5.37]
MGVPTAVSINTDPPVENRTTGVGPTGVYSVTLSNVPPFGKKARASVSCSVPAANFQNTFVVDRPPAPGDTILTVNLA